MPTNPEEIKRREVAARAAIKHAYETDLEELNARLFVSHHLAEMDSSYWQRHLSVDRPASNLVLDLLVLRSHWGGEDKINAFDFTLPERATDYVISVRFDEEGAVAEVSMES